MLYFCGVKAPIMNPNIKIRLPKWQLIRSASWVKELLMTFAGATLSIILTFGTAHFLDQKEQRADGRQTAMMIIHDMEISADLFKHYAKEEEKGFNCAQVLIANIDSLNKVNSDTLNMFVNFISKPAGKQFVYDDSSEQLFLNSQESWKNINNTAFIDAVQEFFYHRRNAYSSLNTHPFFIKPADTEEYYRDMFKEYDINDRERTFFYKSVKKWLEQPQVRQYINFTFSRKNTLDGYVDLFNSFANKCKFMMNISDDELAEYVHNRARYGAPLTERKLIGTWTMLTTEDTRIEREYCRDHAYNNRITYFVPYPLFTGKIEISLTTHGTWEIQGDSLITMIHLSETSPYEIDRSKIQYRPEQAADVEAYIEQCTQSLNAQFGELKTQEDKRVAYYASIDASGNKIEYRENYESEFDSDTDTESHSGSDYKSIYFLRKK
jgi:hypothetical protein